MAGLDEFLMSAESGRGCPAPGRAWRDLL